MKKKILAGILALTTLTTCAVTAVACSDDKQSEAAIEQTMNMGTEVGFSTEFVNSKHIKLMAATPMEASTTTNTASQTLVATVYPTTASNKTVDWSVAWADASKTEAVSDYITVTPKSNGSTTATVTCYKEFTGNIVVTVKTRESGLTADCIVSFVGVPTEIKVTSNIAEQADGYHVGIGSTYTFNVAGDNPFHMIGGNYQNITASLTGVGSLILSYKEYYIATEKTSWYDTSDKEVTLDSLKDKFITVNYENGVLTVNTLKSIESYYGSVKTIDGGRTKSFSDAFRSYVTDCYFTVTLKEAKSGLTKTIKIRFDTTVVAGVEMDENAILF